jgi:hypothetical protein
MRRLRRCWRRPPSCPPLPLPPSPLLPAAAALRRAVAVAAAGPLTARRRLQTGVARTLLPPPLRRLLSLQLLARRVSPLAAASCRRCRPAGGSVPAALPLGSSLGMHPHHRLGSVGPVRSYSGVSVASTGSRADFTIGGAKRHRGGGGGGSGLGGGASASAFAAAGDSLPESMGDALQPAAKRVCVETSRASESRYSSMPGRGDPSLRDTDALSLLALAMSGAAGMDADGPVSPVIASPAPGQEGAHEGNGGGAAAAAGGDAPAAGGGGGGGSINSGSSGAAAAARVPVAVRPLLGSLSAGDHDGGLPLHSTGAPPVVPLSQASWGSQ